MSDSKNMLTNSASFTGYATLYTEFNNPISFYAEDVKKESGSWITLINSGSSYIANYNENALQDKPLNGINKMTINIASGSVKVIYGAEYPFTGDDYYTVLSSSPSNLTFEFDNRVPNRIKILATADNTKIDYLKLEYSCENSYYSFGANSNNENFGKVSKDKAMNYYLPGDSVTLTANPTLFSEFEGWYNGATLISSDPSYTFSMPANNVSYQGKFTGKTKGDTVLFGRYPQTKETDSTIIAALNGLYGQLPTSSNDNGWSQYEWYISSSPANNVAWYLDLDTDSDGEYNYRGVYFTSYRPSSTTYGSSDVNSFQDESGYYTSQVYWFRFEPLEWRILQNNSGDYFVMSTKIIDSEQYSVYSATTQESRSDYEGNVANVYSNNYQYSYLRKFLNVDFYNDAFNASEVGNIQTSIVGNGISSTGFASNEYACDDTNDKIFALSYSEIVNPSYGFGTIATNNDVLRQLKVTDYATCLGCYVYREPGAAYDGCGHWWLRSPLNGSSTLARNVFGGGNVDSHSATFSYGGVAPAMHLK